MSATKDMRTTTKRHLCCLFSWVAWLRSYAVLLRTYIVGYETADSWINTNLSHRCCSTMCVATFSSRQFEPAFVIGWDLRPWTLLQWSPAWLLWVSIRTSFHLRSRIALPFTLGRSTNIGYLCHLRSLVVSTPLENNTVSRYSHPKQGWNKHVWNHRPVMWVCLYCLFSMVTFFSTWNDNPWNF